MEYFIVAEAERQSDTVAHAFFLAHDTTRTPRRSHLPPPSVAAQTRRRRFSVGCAKKSRSTCRSVERRASRKVWSDLRTPNGERGRTPRWRRDGPPLSTRRRHVRRERMREPRHAPRTTHHAPMPADKCNLELGAWGVTYRATVHDTTPHERPSPAQRHQRHPRHNSAPLVCGAPFTPLPLSPPTPPSQRSRARSSLSSHRDPWSAPPSCARVTACPRGVGHAMQAQRGNPSGARGERDGIGGFTSKRYSYCEAPRTRLLQSTLPARSRVTCCRKRAGALTRARIAHSSGAKCRFL